MRSSLLALGLTAGLLSAAANANLNYSFDHDTQGWTALDGTLSYQASGGNSGGFLSILDSTNANMLAMAPAAGLGDWSAYLGGSLSFDALNQNGDSPDWDGFGEVIITGTNGSVSLKLAAPNSPPADGQWHNYSASLTPAAWGGNLAAVLSHVTGVTIQTEFHNGVTEVVGLDNFAVAAVPEPDSYALMLAGVGLMGLVARRRRR